MKVAKTKSNELPNQAKTQHSSRLKYIELLQWNICTESPWKKEEI